MDKRTDYGRFGRSLHGGILQHARARRRVAWRVEGGAKGSKRVWVPRTCAGASRVGRSVVLRMLRIYFRTARALDARAEGGYRPAPRARGGSARCTAVRGQAEASDVQGTAQHGVSTRGLREAAVDAVLDELRDVRAVHWDLRPLEALRVVRVLDIGVRECAGGASARRRARIKEAGGGREEGAKARTCRSRSQSAACRARARSTRSRARSRPGRRSRSRSTRA